ncbi:MAG TPA: HAMP domain-containing histidine kinase [Phycisphaerales bacterium]|nr:HAMP domain-containing histidine kinase [Phycisphaerales bacterium]
MAGDAEPNPSPDELHALIGRLTSRVEALDAQLDAQRNQSSSNLAAALLAHEVYNILTPAMGYARLALQRPEDRALSQKALERVISGIVRTTEIATAVIDMTEGRASSAGERADVLNAAREAVFSLAEYPGESGVTIELRIEPDLSAAISSASLVQIIANLLQNAVRALSGTGGRVWIETQRVTSSTWNHGGIRLSVIDDGPGINQSIRDSIFDPFVHSGSKTGDGAIGGRGLGLTVCKQLIEAVGGELEVSSVPGHGACFSMLLPAADALPTAA